MIPNKSNFKFQELTPITGVKPYVIRFWETEFPEISPVNSAEGQKLYSRSDVETILTIKKFLFDEKLSIPEAKAKMAEIIASDPVREFHSPSMEEKKASSASKIQASLDLISDIKFKRNW